MLLGWKTDRLTHSLHHLVVSLSFSILFSFFGFGHGQTRRNAKQQTTSVYRHHHHLYIMRRRSFWLYLCLPWLVFCHNNNNNNKKPPPKKLKAVVVGAGPAGAAAAIALQQRGWSVTLLDKRYAPNKRRSLSSSSSSSSSSSKNSGAYNVTLTLRAFAMLLALDPSGKLQTAIENGGTKLQSRASVSSNSFLSVPMTFDNVNLPVWRIVQPMVAFAKQQGCKCLFGYECLGVKQSNTRGKPTVTLVRFLNHSNQKIVEIPADLVVGADGANSAVRSSLQRSSFGFEIIQDHEGSQGAVSVEVALHENKLTNDEELEDGFQNGRLTKIGPALYWAYTPKGMVVVQPNCDNTCNIVLASSILDGVEPNGNAIQSALLEAAPAYAPLLTKQACERISQQRPIAGKSVRVNRLHGDCSVLIGDAGHTMLNNLGQGANSALEDVGILMEELETVDCREHIPAALQRFSDKRIRDVHAATELSKRAFTISEALPSKLNQRLYTWTYLAFQTLHGLAPSIAVLKPWQWTVNQDSNVPYTRISELKSFQSMVGLFFAVLSCLVLSGGMIATIVYLFTGIDA